MILSNKRLEITSMSTRGQVVIPQGIRERLDIQPGEKFMVIGENNTILLKKIEPSFEGFEELLKKTRALTKEIKQSEVKETIKKVRKR